MKRFKHFVEEKKEKEITSGFMLNKDGTVSVVHDTSNNRNKKSIKESFLKKVFGKADHEKSLDDHAASHNKEDHSEHLKKHSADLHKDPHEAKAVHHFKSSSREINHNLINDHKRGVSSSFTYDHRSAKKHKLKGNEHEQDDHGSDSHAHHTIMKHAKPLGKKITLYHGTDHDFGKAAKDSKGGIIHSPAHLSTSHDHKVSKDFGKHVVAIHAGKNDKAVHLDGKGGHDQSHEKETVVPAGTKLKHIKSHKTSDGYTVHHFKIHSHEDHKPYDKD